MHSQDEASAASQVYNKPFEAPRSVQVRNEQRCQAFELLVCDSHICSPLKKSFFCLKNGLHGLQIGIVLG